MGCIAVKKKQCLNGHIQQLALQTEQDVKQVNGITRMETCSTMATNSARTLRSKFFRRSSSISSDQNGMISIFRSTIQNQISLKEGQFNFRLQTAFTKNQEFQLICDEENIPIFTQMVHGFPQENIVLLKTSISSQKGNIPSLKHLDSLNSIVNFILKDNISLFVKLLLQCQICFKVTKVTKCTAIFNLDFSNCDCNCEQIGFCIVKSQPSHIRIWCDDLNESISSQKHSIKIINKKSNLRVIGCTSCWNFKNLKLRQTCKCAVCYKCQGTDCQICHN